MLRKANSADLMSVESGILKGLSSFFFVFGAVKFTKVFIPL